MSGIQPIKQVFSGIGGINCSKEFIPQFDTKNKIVSISRCVVAALIAIVATSLVALGCVVIIGCCPLGMIAGGVAVLLGLALLAWAVLIALRLLNIPKARSEVDVKVSETSQEGFSSQEEISTLRTSRTYTELAKEDTTNLEVNDHSNS